MENVRRKIIAAGGFTALPPVFADRLSHVGQGAGQGCSTEPLLR